MPWFLYSYSIVLLPGVHLIFNLNAPRLALYPYLHLFFRLLSAQFLRHCTHLPSLQRKKHLYYPRRFDFFIVCLPQFILIGLWFYNYIYQSSHKTMLFYYSRFLRLIFCHQCNRNTLNFPYCSSKNDSSGLRLYTNMVLLITSAPHCNHSGN